MPAVNAETATAVEASSHCLVVEVIGATHTDVCTVTYIPYADNLLSKARTHVHYSLNDGVAHDLKGERA